MCIGPRAIQLGTVRRAQPCASTQPHSYFVVENGRLKYLVNMCSLKMYPSEINNLASAKSTGINTTTDLWFGRVLSTCCNRNLVEYQSSPWCKSNDVVYEDCSISQHIRIRRSRGKTPI